MGRRPARKPKRRAEVPGLTWRGPRAYWQRVHERLPGGRVHKSLSTSDPLLAVQYAAALNTLMERGDWGVIQRWTDGYAHVTDLVRAVREGDYSRLRRLNMDGVRLGEAVDAFLERAEATVSENRAAGLRVVLGGIADALGRDAPMHDIGTPDVEHYLHAVKPTTGGVWAAGTQGQVRTIGKALWSFAMEREADEAIKSDAAVSIVSNPWRKARVPKRRRTRFAFCTPEEARAVLNHTSNLRLPRRAMMALGFYAGLRRGEIQHLRPDIDIDLDAAVVRVQSRPAPVKWRPKTDHSERDVPLPPAAVAILREHIELGFAGDRYVFRAPGKDLPVSGRTMERWAELAYTAVGLRYGRDEGDALTLHSARHSYATWLLSEGVPLATVARRLGDTEAVVLDVYSHVMPRDEERANLVMAQLAGDPKRQAPGGQDTGGGAVRSPPRH